MADSFTIGVDVGGTNTDVVVLRGFDVVEKVKLATTQDIISGVSLAVIKVLNALAEREGLPLDQVKRLITRVNIGTTHFINAVIQRKGLDRVSVIRLCGPSSRAIPPFSDFPGDLKNAIYGSCHLVNGGYHYDGKEISAVDEKEIRLAVDHVKEIGVKNIIVSGFYLAKLERKTFCCFLERD